MFLLKNLKLLLKHTFKYFQIFCPNCVNHCTSLVAFKVSKILAFSEHLNFFKSFTNALSFIFLSPLYSPDHECVSYAFDWKSPQALVAVPAINDLIRLQSRPESIFAVPARARSFRARAIHFHSTG
jgi:hypothetical protein